MEFGRCQVLPKTALVTQPLPTLALFQVLGNPAKGHPMHAQFEPHQSHLGSGALRPTELVPILNHLHSLETEGVHHPDMGLRGTPNGHVHLLSAGVQGFSNPQTLRCFLSQATPASLHDPTLAGQSRFFQLRLQGERAHLCRLRLGIRQTPGTPNSLLQSPGLS